MVRRRVGVSWLVVAVAATVVPSVAGVPSAGAQSAPPVCAATWNPVRDNWAELSVRCSTPGQATDVRVGYWWQNKWQTGFTTAHAATQRFHASPTAVEWRVGSVGFGSNKPFDGVDTPVDVLIDGRWQRATIAGFDRTTPLVEPWLPTDGPAVDRGPAPLAAARCAVHWNPTGGTRAELWVRCATAVKATDVRVGFWWQNTWNPTFATDHAATQRFETSRHGVEWRVGPVDFGSTRPFDGVSTPVQVMVDGRWLPAAVSTFARTTPLTDPGVPGDGPGIGELRALQDRVADITDDCPPSGPDATGVKVTIDIAAGTCLVDITVDDCVGIDFFCDHHDTLIVGIAGIATAAIAIPVVPALATAASTGASTLGAAWQSLAGLNITIGGGTALTATGGALVPVGTGLTITGQHLVLAGGALTLNNIGTYLSTNSTPGNLAEHERYKDALREEMERPHVEDPDLAHLLDEMWRPRAEVGNGSTAAAVRFELANPGSTVGGQAHIQKAENYVRALEAWMRRHPTATSGDRAAAQNVLRDLTNALMGQ